MEENFEDLLSEYLDGEEMNWKRNLEMIETESDNVLVKSPFSFEDAISIHEFVSNYLGMLGNYQNLLHSGLKELNIPYVIGVDNRFANKNPELVFKGYFLIVLDFKKRRGTYVNPIYLKEMFEKDIEKELKCFLKMGCHDFEKLQTYLNVYTALVMRVEKNQAFNRLLLKLHKGEHIEKIKQLEYVRRRER